LWPIFLPPSRKPNHRSESRVAFHGAPPGGPQSPLQTGHGAPARAARGRKSTPRGNICPGQPRCVNQKKKHGTPRTPSRTPTDPTTDSADPTAELHGNQPRTPAETTADPPPRTGRGPTPIAGACDMHLSRKVKAVESNARWNPVAVEAVDRRPVRKSSWGASAPTPSILPANGSE
jgi:hypothetical protein